MRDVSSSKIKVKKKETYMYIFVKSEITLYYKSLELGTLLQSSDSKLVSRTLVSSVLPGCQTRLSLENAYKNVEPLGHLRLIFRITKIFY